MVTNGKTLRGLLPADVGMHHGVQRDGAQLLVLPPLALYDGVMSQIK
jgi:hypothetical protein